MKTVISSSVVVLLVSLLTSSFALAGDRQAELQSAQEQKATNLQMLDEEASLLDKTLDEIRNHNQVNQTATPLSLNILGVNELLMPISRFRASLVDPFHNG